MASQSGLNLLAASSRAGYQGRSQELAGRGAEEGEAGTPHAQRTTHNCCWTQRRSMEVCLAGWCDSKPERFLVD